jgi:hypothetical protein
MRPQRTPAVVQASPLAQSKWHDESDLSAVSQCRVIGFPEFPCRGCRVRQETELK